jgi:acyl-CoA thioester hydrolase
VPFRHRLRVRYHECDAQGVVFNAHYLAYCDIAITEMWRALYGSYERLIERGVDHVVAESTLRFRSPARFDDELDVDVALRRLGTTSMQVAFEIRRDSDVVCEVASRYVFVDPETLQKQAPPDDIRSLLESLGES